MEREQRTGVVAHVVRAAGWLGTGRRRAPLCPRAGAQRGVWLVWLVSGAEGSGQRRPKVSLGGGPGGGGHVAGSRGPWTQGARRPGRGRVTSALKETGASWRPRVGVPEGGPTVRQPSCGTERLRPPIQSNQDPQTHSSSCDTTLFVFRRRADGKQSVLCCVFTLFSLEPMPGAVDEGGRPASLGKVKETPSQRRGLWGSRAPPLPSWRESRGRLPTSRGTVFAVVSEEGAVHAAETWFQGRETPLFPGFPGPAREHQHQLWAEDPGLGRPGLRLRGLSRGGCASDTPCL